MKQSSSIFSPSWITIVILVSISISSITAFSPLAPAVLPLQRHGRSSTRKNQQKLQLAIGPIIEATNVISLIGNPNDLIQTTKALTASSPLLQAAINQLVVLTADASSAAVLKPAAGHKQPLWGPPDPYLSAGHSIAPSAKALADLGIDTKPMDLPGPIQAAIDSGYNILDAATIKAENILPGFKPTGGILPTHNPRVPVETSATFAAQVEWSAKFLNVVDKLPEAAFAYALVEFFLIRPGIDIYKEDVELQQEEGAGALTAETLAVTTVRLGVFLIIAIVTTGIFG